MITIDSIFQNAVESWRSNKGNGTMLCPLPLNNKIPILLILQRIYNNNPACNTTIIVENFNDRLDLIEFLTTQEDEDNNNAFKQLIDNKHIRIFTHTYFNNTNWNGFPTFGILYNIEEFDNKLYGWIQSAKFKLIVINKLFSNQEDNLRLNKVCPILSEFKQNEIDELRTSRPVEEMLVGVTIPEDTETSKLLEYYNKEITTTLNIFGNFDNIKRARVGDSTLNMSAVEFCNRIAFENGWNEHLDMSTEYNIEIDRVYNPNKLNERATKCYEMIRLRSQLLSDFEGKLNEIYKICKENEEKKILIINKRGEFAAKVTNYLNQMFGDVVCGDYHNKLENIILRNSDGTPVLVKSGVNKGKPKEIGYKAQMTLNQKKFNEGTINILSTSNSPDKDLNIDVDIIIITSPLCEDIKSYLYRLSKVNYREETIKLYTIFCKSTMEHKQVLNKEVSINHKIVNKYENIDISENNSCFVVVD